MAIALAVAAFLTHQVFTALLAGRDFLDVRHFHVVSLSTSRFTKLCPTWDNSPNSRRLSVPERRFQIFNLSAINFSELSLRESNPLRIARRRRMSFQSESERSRDLSVLAMRHDVNRRLAT